MPISLSTNPARLTIDLKALKPINIPPKLNKPAKSDGKGKATKRAAGGNATESDADDEGSTAPVSEEDKITIPAHLYELLYQSPHEATSFHLACQKICNDPKQRQKYFPVANEVRRIRQWAGSELPEDIEKGVEKQLPSSYTTKRAFGPSKVALVSLTQPCAPEGN